ncbi:hypothetical protein SSAG_04543 [Streptomyces sp. Mg1]|nr:hypothetical protein SSAG_04543 [Streptomyces sp. Mg1]
MPARLALGLAVGVLADGRRACVLNGHETYLPTPALPGNRFGGRRSLFPCASVDAPTVISALSARCSELPRCAKVPPR